MEKFPNFKDENKKELNPEQQLFEEARKNSGLILGTCFELGYDYEARNMPENGAANYFGSNPGTEKFFGVEAFFAGIMPISHELAKKESIEFAITITAVTKLEPILEEAEERRSWFSGRKKAAPRQVGTTAKPAPLSEYVSQSEYTGNAYRIIFEARGMPDFHGRAGNTLEAHVLLPEPLARKIFALAEKNPEAILRLLRELDPQTMAKVEEKLPPKSSRALVVPEGKINEVLEFDTQNQGRAIGIKKEFIRDFSGKT